MQIWRTALSAPGTSRMKARLVSLRCFVVTMFPQKVLLYRRSGLLCLAVATSCCVSERHEKGYKSSTVHLKLTENNGSMQFVETKKRSSRSPRELKFVRYISH